MRKQRIGWILCTVDEVLPMWIDCTCVKTGRKLTFLTKYKPFDWLHDYIGTSKHVSIQGKVTDDPDIYQYIRISMFRQYTINSKVRRIKAEQELEATLNENYNPVKGKGKNKYAPAPTRKEGKGKMTQAINQAVKANDEAIARKLKELGL